MKLYCDNAAQKPLTDKVKQTIIDFLESDYGNPSAIYSKGRRAKQALEKARETVARCIGAEPNEIFFTSGASEGINWFCRNVNRVYTTTIEHKAVLRNANQFMPVNSTGIINLDVFNRECPHYGNVVVGWANNEIGTIQPVKEIVDICHKKHSSILIDATQAIGHIPIDVHELSIDFLVGSFGKLGGLTGSGFLYMRKGMHLEPMIKGGGQEYGMRASTENILGILVGATAIEEATKDIEQRTISIRKNRDKIISELLKLPNTQINGDMGNRLAGNINISFEGVEAESLVLMLDTLGISISAGSACNSVSVEPSHVLKAIGLSDDIARSTIRITIDEMTDEEVDYLIDAIKGKVNYLRKISKNS